MIQNAIPTVAFDGVLNSLHRQVDQIQEEARALHLIHQQGQLPDGVSQVYQDLLVEIDHLRCAMCQLEEITRKATLSE